MIPTRSRVLTAGVAAASWMRRSLAAPALLRVAFQTPLLPARAASLSPGAAPVASQAKAVFVKAEGAPGWAELEACADMYVAHLLKEAVKALPSLKAHGLDWLTIHLAQDAAGDKLGNALDSSKTLSELMAAHVGAVSLVIKRTSAAPSSMSSPQPQWPKLPQPLLFKETTLGGEPWMEGRLELDIYSRAPFYLTTQQHWELQRFINEETSPRPQLFMAVGTIKSGKSTMLRHVLPGMIAAAAASSWPAGRKRPVIFCYTFHTGADALTAVAHFSRNVAYFGRHINIPFVLEETEGGMLANLHHHLAQFSERISKAGGELWLLLDELQAPTLASSPQLADAFTRALKKMIEHCSPWARIAATDSGMASLLNSFRNARVHGFAVWGATTFLSLGRAPAPAAALDIAARIHSAYTARWPQDKRTRGGITANVLMAALASEWQLSRLNQQNAELAAAMQGELAAVTSWWAPPQQTLTSCRPALLAFTLGFMGDGQRGTAQRMMADAGDLLVGKLAIESLRDTAAALRYLRPGERLVLLEVANGQYTFDDLMEIIDSAGQLGFKGRDVGDGMDALARLIMHLSEAGSGKDVVRLQPPYPQLLSNWVCKDGTLAVAFDDDDLRLDPVSEENLKIIANTPTMWQGAGPHVSAAVLTSLRNNHIFEEVPASAAACCDVPSLAALHRRLSTAGHASDLAKLLLKKGLSADAFKAELGWAVLTSIHHHSVHTWGSAAHLTHNGLTVAVVADALHAASAVLVEHVPQHYKYSATDPGKLVVIE